MNLMFKKHEAIDGQMSENLVNIHYAIHEQKEPYPTLLPQQRIFCSAKQFG